MGRVGEPMGDSRKKLTATATGVRQPETTGCREHRLGVGPWGGGSRRCLSGWAVWHKPPPLSTPGVGLDGMQGPPVSGCEAQTYPSGCLGSGRVRSRGGLCAGTQGSSCARPSVFGVHLPVCGARGCWRACTCSLLLRFGASVCEGACECGCARDGRPWVCLGGWGRRWGKVALLSASSRGSHTPLAFTVLK